MENSRLVPDAFVGRRSGPTQTEQVRTFSRTQGVLTLAFCTAVVSWVWFGLFYGGIVFRDFDVHPGSSIATICSLTALGALIVWYFTRSEGAVSNAGYCSFFSMMVASFLLLISTLIANTV